MATAKKAPVKGGAPKGNKNAAGNAGGKGKRTLYRPEFVRIAEGMALLGATDAEMAAAFEVSERTFTDWKRRHVELSAVLKSAKLPADGNVARSLYQRAVGYSHPEDDIRTVSIGNGMSEIVITPTMKHYPPDTGAASLWLRNRQPHKWKDKIEVKEDINLNVFPPKAELDAMYTRLLTESKESESKIITGRMERLGIKPDSSGDQE
ncbi:helix-turn-helix domain-containing protein [Eoetvoesiella caeni]|uniref:Terminase small subunit n=1 Tax=Eoetvoesiella caeni TaxID=645616 RepID=A0A366HAA5_9BURK|nr:helix-turn-helix domain-containing protein [Eoetvoesiella caeni]MCI2809538.1 hypothetical protein [Eoetvoesiella caeni]NYT56034.1 helix-turn-helix domain-containing protein [Eoetvoesiella caeni]RBP38797.1 hypothetical protein DFR37_10689 [Eoetvoesiella caeni]